PPSIAPGSPRFRAVSPAPHGSTSPSDRHRGVCPEVGPANPTAAAHTTPRRRFSPSVDCLRSAIGLRQPWMMTSDYVDQPTLEALASQVRIDLVRYMPCQVEDHRRPVQTLEQFLVRADGYPRAGNVVAHLQRSRLFVDTR